ncbi:MAG: DUF502 domain-containing protein [Acidobacteria bacterium]|uniref:DUF502 domain-containing protein n=1 Tax=Candidatus Polarisedimenticola svalbardensis TaxID=2886004 RepID=A0A8J7CE32_9BACT|nr:DUF502 domain-containing protein [Candidatus Polarisedimenticola svalbardensis]
MRSKMLFHIRSRTVRGLLLILPMLVTIWLLKILFDLINTYITPMVVAVFRAAGSPDLDRWQARIGFPIIGLLLTVLAIYLCGLLAGNIVGRRLVLMVESLVLRIPVVKGIYGAARQLLDAFSFAEKKTFSKVVLVEYPRKGLWTIGFVTTEKEHGITGQSSHAVPVFLPTTPNPTSGWLLFVPLDDLIVLDLPMEEAIKLVVSGGIVSPDDIGPLLRPPGRSLPEAP